MQSLSGKWIGKYVYGRGYEESKLIGTQCHFEIMLEQFGDRIKGTCFEEATIEYWSSPATLEGSFTNDRINFIKKYPSYWAGDSEKTIIYDNTPSHEIHYTGTLHKRIFSKRLYFVGTWVIKSFISPEDGQPYECGAQGTWRMEQAK
jgi:hypothetical protein